MSGLPRTEIVAEQSQSLSTDRGSSDENPNPYRLVIGGKEVAIPQYRSRQFRHDLTGSRLGVSKKSQSLGTDQGNSDVVYTEIERLRSR